MDRSNSLEGSVLWRETEPTPTTIGAAPGEQFIGTALDRDRCDRR
jgi:hypothetical protein